VSEELRAICKSLQRCKNGFARSAKLCSVAKTGLHGLQSYAVLQKTGLHGLQSYAVLKKRVYTDCKVLQCCKNEYARTAKHCNAAKTSLRGLQSFAVQ
jgi:hypothetical protein